MSDSIRRASQPRVSMSSSKGARGGSEKGGSVAKEHKWGVIEFKQENHTVFLYS